MPPPPGIEPSKYLRYHVEHWLHTIYVLRERTASYISRVGKLYKGSDAHAMIREQALEVRPAFDEAFGIVLSVRGHHVHVSDTTPPQVADLMVFEQLEAVRGSPNPNHPAVPRYSEVAREWSDEFGKANEGIVRVLDELFGRLHPLLFDGDTPRYPPAHAG
jgi:hypothetical protein